MIRVPKVGRRALLRASGGIAVGLPLLQAMRSRSRAGGAAPKRFVGVFSPNGMVMDRWVPSTEGGGFGMSPILAPLETHRNKLLVVSGLDNRAGSTSAAEPHTAGIASVFTGARTVDAESHSAADGPSVDQVIATELASGTRFNSLEFSVMQQETGAIGGAMAQSRGGYGGRLPGMDDPREAFDRVFGDVMTGGMEDATAARIRRERRSVLDFVLDDIGRLQATVGAEDRRKLDSHFSAIRSIETRLEAFSGMCAIPGRPDFSGGIYDYANFPTLGRLHMDLLVMALACDLSRVATLQWSNATSSVVCSWLGLGPHHEYTHNDSLGRSAADESLEIIDRWYSEQFAYLVGALDSVSEGDGTLLDHSVVIWGNELSDGHSHALDGVPFVLAGGCNGFFNTGRHVSFSGRAHNDLLLTCMHAMDVPAGSFGVEELNQGILSELLA